MFVGHYSISFAANAVEKRLPLWSLFVTVQLVDIIWAVFVLFGIEKVRIVPGLTASSPLDLYYMPYTHSLPGALGWSLFACGLCQFIPTTRGLRAGIVAALAVFSHWILDLMVHRPDLPLYDNSHKVGYGLYNYRGAEFGLEALLLVAGAIYYFYRSERTSSPIRTILLVGFMVGLQAIGTFVFRPHGTPHGVATNNLILYALFALGAYATDRTRAPHKHGDASSQTS